MPYRFDLAMLTVYNAADGNQKGDTSISGKASISGYDGVLQFWVEKGMTLGEVLTKNPEFGVLTFSCWVDGEDPGVNYPENTPVNSAMAVAAKYIDNTDQSGFVVGEKYYFFDDDFTFRYVGENEIQTIKHYLGYYGGTVRFGVDSVKYTGIDKTRSAAQARRIVYEHCHHNHQEFDHR